MPRTHRQKCLCYLVAGAAASATPTSGAAGRGRFGGGAVAGAIRCGKDGKLDRGFLAGALGAGNFLLLIQDDALEARIAFIAKVFVDRHVDPSSNG